MTVFVLNICIANINQEIGRQHMLERQTRPMCDQRVIWYYLEVTLLECYI